VANLTRESYDCDVAIVGCGPTGVVLANLLGQLGVRVVVLERDAEVYAVPRATHIDEETLRNFQATGLIDALLPHTMPFGRLQVVDRDGTVLLDNRVEEPETPHGYEGSRFFDQPAFERILRDGLARYDAVRLVTGAEVTAVEQNGDGVVVRAGDAATVRASWVVGCDGGRSAVRGALGIETERLARKREWVIVDSLLKDPADAPRLPGCFQYILAPERLSLYAHGVGLNRRWEFQLANGEGAPSEAEVLGWVSAHVDLGLIEITRITSYAHTSMLAKTWRVGRVFVAGDAAHLMPPSAGQGMCSGIRDAVNLAWKLHLVVSGRAGAGLLDTYEVERKPHAREVLEGTLFIGRQLEANTGFERWRRRLQLRLLGAMPQLGRLLQSRGLRRPPLRAGFLDGPKAGRPLPHVRVRRDGAVVWLDDLVGYRFALVARAGAIGDADAGWASARGIGLWRPGVDFEEVDGRLVRWMEREGVDFALARPDRQLFAAGRAGGFARVRAAFDRWIE
jgi:3-(3-hydroxy-phenyl)propionate hydroxylase